MHHNPLNLYNSYSFTEKNAMLILFCLTEGLWKMFLFCLKRSFGFLDFQILVIFLTLA